MAVAIYHKSSKGRPAYIIKNGERLATFLNQPTYATGTMLARALSDGAQVVFMDPASPEGDRTSKPIQSYEEWQSAGGRRHLEHVPGKAQILNEMNDVIDDLVTLSRPVATIHNPRSLSHGYNAKGEPARIGLADDEFYNVTIPAL